MDLVSLLADTSSGAPNLADALYETVGRLHPVMVHLPLGLVLAAAVVEVVRGVQRRPGNSPFTPVALALAAVCAAGAVATGWIFATEQRESEELFWHRWLGIAVAGGLIPLAWTAWRAARPGDRAAQQLVPLVRAGVVACALAVAWVGHLGGGMTWGENFALRPLMAWWRGSNGPVGGALPGVASGAGAGEGKGADGAGEASGSGAGFPGAAEEGVAFPGAGADGAGVGAVLAERSVRVVAYTREVLPLLEERCYECHARGKHKGGLALDDPQSLLGQNDIGQWIVKPGDASASLLLARVSLPAGHDDAMPPKGERLTVEEIRLLGEWIARGALLSTDEARGAAVGADTSTSAREPASAAPPAGQARTAPPVEWPTTAAPELTDPARRALAELRARGVIAQPLSLRDGWLEVNASARGAVFADADLDVLAPLAPWVVELNLARTGITDQGLASAARMPALTVLRLDGTAAGDAGVAAVLDGAPDLQTLNLVEARVSDATLRRLARAERLRTVYLWGTPVTDAALVELAGARPALVVHSGARR